jgi:uncharacterized protein (DUF2252 family)
MDPIDNILAFNAGREPERLAIKYAKMRANAFAFMRGSSPLFYDRIVVTGLFKNLPLVWSCGDAHMENFGSYKGDNRLVYFDLNDFDEAALAPISWDLVRMVASIFVACASAEKSTLESRVLCGQFLSTYSATLQTGKAYWVERDTATGPVRALLDGLKSRSRALFLDGRTETQGGKRRIRLDGKKALAASKAQIAQVKQFMQGFAQTQANPAFYKVQHVARRIAGNGSLGLDRFVVLVRGKGPPDGSYLLDLKRAVPSSLAAHVSVKQPRWPSEAHRIVGLQQRCQAVPMAFLHPVRFDGQAFVLRGLQPAEDRVEVDLTQASGSLLRELLTTQAQVLAWAHLRGAGRQGAAGIDDLIDFAARKKWQEKLLIAAEAAAQQVQRDAIRFNAAFDKGGFGA